MISTKEKRELRLELLKAAGWDIARAQDLESYVFWGLSREEFRKCMKEAWGEGRGDEGA